jgi:hypothetical protein
MARSHPSRRRLNRWRFLRMSGEASCDNNTLLTLRRPRVLNAISKVRATSDDPHPLVEVGRQSGFGFCIAYAVLHHSDRP